ncbi:MAG: hypothetical protein J6Q84_07225 [Kiritimatiellae bacterium]|nr:hypothetical protein [Kiritimatiellia bacterium]
MNKLNFTKLVKGVGSSISKHSPEILTGIGVAGMITSTVLAVKATPKALRLIDDRKFEEDREELTPIETIKTCWRCYIPAAVIGVVSGGCIFGATSVNLRRNAALATAYKISETALTEYREKVIETIGEKKEREVREKVSQKRLDENPISKHEVYITDKGDTLFCDPVSKRYFKHDIDKVKRVVNELNRQMMFDMSGSISLTDFYYEIGLEKTDISDYIGWNLADGLIEIDYNPGKDEYDRPCIVLDYVRPPKHHFE